MVSKELRLRITQTGATQATNEMNRLGKSVGLVAARYIGWAAVIAGAVKIVKSSIDSYSRQEMAVTKLSAALGKSTASLESYSNVLQRTTMYADETILEAQAMLAAFTKDEAQIRKLTVAVMDLAAAKRMDLVSAADLVGKSIGSSTNALARYGLTIEGAASSTERMQSLTKEIASLFGGQAAAQADTYAGSITIMANAWDEAAEKLGAFITHILEASGVINFFTGVAGGLSIVLDKILPEQEKKGINVWEAALKSYEKYQTKLEEDRKKEDERWASVKKSIMEEGIAVPEVAGVTRKGPIERMAFAAHDLAAGLKEVQKIAGPAFKELAGESDAIVANWDAIANTMVSSFDWAFRETLVRGENMFQSLASAFEQMIAQMAASFLARSFVFGLMNLFTGGGFAGNFLSFATGGMFEGGPAAIAPYGGQAKININFNGPISDRRYIKQVVVPEVMKALR